MLTYKTPWRSYDSWTKHVRGKGSFTDTTVRTALLTSLVLNLKKKFNCLKNYLKIIEKKLINVLVGAIPVSGEIQEWLRSLVVRLNWLNEFCQRSLSADSFFIAGISLNDLAERERLPSLRYVSKHFLLDTSVFSFAWIFHYSASRHPVNNTHEQIVKI